MSALKSVSAVAPAGAITGVLGPNGCGKTTLVKSVLGLVVPDAGRIVVQNTEVLSSGEHRKYIGYVPQNPDFPGNLTISELLELVQDLRGEAASSLSALVMKFNLSHVLDRNFGQLSGGTKQKVATVIALMFDAPVLILDEPSVGLDPVSRRTLRDLLVGAASDGKTVVIVSHLMSEVEPILSNVTFLLEGEVRFAGSLAEIQGMTPSGRLEDAVYNLASHGGR